MADNLPKSTAELMTEIEREWKALMRVVERLTPEQMVKPDAGGWSPKDNLAHLAAWMRYMKETYLQKKPAEQVMGIEAAKLSQLNDDGINAILFERNRNRAASDVLDSLQRTYAEVVEYLRTAPFETLLIPRYPDDPQKRPMLFWVVANTTDHFIEHRKVIERNLQAFTG